MPKRRSGPSNTRRQTGAVRGRRALNAFRIDKEAIPTETREAEETLEQSDSEGVKSEDDEDIDSDEAFDESDEERFSTFKFSGSTSKGGKGTARSTSARDNGANEDSGEEEDESADEDDDEIYMDLSDMLANGQSAGNPPKLQNNGPAKKPTNDSEEEEYDDSDESVLGDSDSEQDDGQLESLSAFVDSLASKKAETQSEPQSVAEKPNVEVSSDLSMNDILASLTDPSLQSFRKSLASQQTSKSKSVGQKLSAPLARPLQERLERQAAYEETKAEITKWQPLVKANREADHLQFPMNEPPKQTNQSTAALAGTFEPSTTLEKNIDELLRASGIRDEKEITKFEDLAMKRVSIDEVRQRQSQLRAMRELMFRQDQKAKRIAKIKSKAYRKIHKRERERELERQMAEDGEDGEDARERKLKAETARARERMTLRHKNTGEWAKKMLSRGQHDLETRQAISEQIQRGDELKRKIMGDDDESGEEESVDGEELEELLNDPNKWGEEKVSVDTPEIRKGVMGMKFMRDAEERQKQFNAQQIAEIKATIDGGSDDDEIIVTAEPISGPVNQGRKTFIPGDEVEQIKHVTEINDEQEDNAEEVVTRIVKNPFHMTEPTRNAANTTKSSTSRIATDEEIQNFALSKQSKTTLSSVESTSQNINVEPTTNPWLSISYKKPSKTSTSDNRITKIQSKRKRDDLDNANALVNIDVSIDAINEKLAAVTREREENDEDIPTMIYGRGKKIAFQQTELINRAFAADGFEQDFAIEKEAAIAEDAPKEEDLTLPGWGSWTGQGVKRRATEKKIIKKVPGIEASQRKDAKLKHVIINEKQVKKNQKYMASGIPYPFETREQYERSLSMPVGPEWTTREMYQKITKPRITIRAGVVVNPLQAPFK